MKFNTAGYVCMFAAGLNIYGMIHKEPLNFVAFFVCLGLGMLMFKLSKGE